MDGTAYKNTRGQEISQPMEGPQGHTEDGGLQPSYHHSQRWHSSVLKDGASGTSESNGGDRLSTNGTDALLYRGCMSDDNKVGFIQYVIAFLFIGAVFLTIIKVIWEFGKALYAS